MNDAVQLRRGGRITLNPRNIRAQEANPTYHIPQSPQSRLNTVTSRVHKLKEYDDEIDNEQGEQTGTGLAQRPHKTADVQHKEQQSSPAIDRGDKVRPAQLPRN